MEDHVEENDLFDSIFAQPTKASKAAKPQAAMTKVPFWTLPLETSLRATRSFENPSHYANRPP